MTSFRALFSLHDPVVFLLFRVGTHIAGSVMWDLGRRSDSGLGWINGERLAFQRAAPFKSSTLSVWVGGNEEVRDVTPGNSPSVLHRRVPFVGGGKTRVLDGVN